jgi:hypothetical protein
MRTGDGSEDPPRDDGHSSNKIFVLGAVPAACADEHTIQVMEEEAREAKERERELREKALVR